MTAHPVVLTIAGFDPSSGAGITADIKTIAAHACYGLACITALTVQSTLGVHRVQPVKAELVTETLDTLAADIDIAGVHLGMLGTAEVAEAVADFLARWQLRTVVLDPILKSSSGASLLDPGGIRILKEKLIRLASVVTPNIEEAAALTGQIVSNPIEMREAAGRLQELGARAVVVTGGHLDPAIDLLSCPGQNQVRQEEFSAPRLDSHSTHGTGCAFATALTCNLAKGHGLSEAVQRAKSYVTRAIAAGYPIGKGAGPIDHLYGRAKA
jgi:hydroxymethylpyrimidine/phosphomethylpyrimidine kinase